MPKKRCCVFTFVKNEKIFLPIWLKYYSRFFDKDDIYVLDHGTDDGSVQECSKHYGFKVIKLHHEVYDEIWRTGVVCQKQTELLQSYEYVLFTDADEIIIPNPGKYKDLKDYILRCAEDCVVCAGHELIHIRQKEPPIDLSKPILNQREYWYPNHFYDKPLLARKPLVWAHGFHNAVNMGGYRDKDLWLLHLHKMDYDLCWDKHKSALNYKWNDECVRQNLGFQFRINNVADFKKYFDTRHPDYKELRIGRWWHFIRLSFLKAWTKAWIKAWILKKGSLCDWSEKGFNFVRITRIPGTLLRNQTV